MPPRPSSSMTSKPGRETIGGGCSAGDGASTGAIGMASGDSEVEFWEGDLVGGAVVSSGVCPIAGSHEGDRQALTSVDADGDRNVALGIIEDRETGRNRKPSPKSRRSGEAEMRRR